MNDRERREQEADARSRRAADRGLWFNYGLDINPVISDPVTEQGPIGPTEKERYEMNQLYDNVSRNYEDRKSVLELSMGAVGANETKKQSSVLKQIIALGDDLISLGRIEDDARRRNATRWANEIAKLEQQFLQKYPTLRYTGGLVTRPTARALKRSSPRRKRSPIREYYAASSQNRNDEAVESKCHGGYARK